MNWQPTAQWRVPNPNPDQRNPNMPRITVAQKVEMRQQCLSDAGFPDETKALKTTIAAQTFQSIADVSGDVAANGKEEEVDEGDESDDDLTPMEKALRVGPKVASAKPKAKAGAKAKAAANACLGIV